MPSSSFQPWGDQEALRQVNLSAVLTLLRQIAPVSRTVLAKRTGLNKATISRIVRDLIDQGLVRETGSKSSPTGRPSILLELNPDGGYIIGAGIEVDSCSVILTNFSAEILWRQDEFDKKPQTQQSIIECIVPMITAAVAKAQKLGKPIIGMGLSVPGLINADEGYLYIAPNMGWKNVPLKKMLEEQFDFPIYVDNEANMSALGESYFGVMRDCNYGIYLDITAGVGAGIVMNHKILPGASGLSGEVGHMTINPDGPRCNCGNRGCLETYISLTAISKRVTEAIKNGQESLLSPRVESQAQPVNIEQIVEAAEMGDAVALAALKETGEYVGIGVANVINAFNPKQVILGGYIGLAQKFILPEVNRVVQERALDWPHQAADILVAKYGTDARLMGAIATVYGHVLSKPVQTAAKRWSQLTSNSHTS